MTYRLNLFLKNFGVNASPSITFFPKNKEEIKKLINGYKPVLKNYSLYGYEYEICGNVSIEIRTEFKHVELLDMLPE